MSKAYTRGWIGVIVVVWRARGVDWHGRVIGIWAAIRRASCFSVRVVDTGTGTEYASLKPQASSPN